MSKLKELRLVHKFSEDDNEFESYLLLADFKEREVRTNCGDFYYDYSISFDDFIKFAHLIENQERKLK